jgi:acyl carrier protein
MTRAQLRQAVLDALTTVVPEARPPTINPAAPLRDQLDMDSMDFINFVITMDEALGVDVPESEYGRLATLDDCVDYLAGRLGVPATPA